jgi:2-polyprenyl-6-methoxyphenol hydroxylase-like FAD-dependent oxidoreductase
VAATPSVTAPVVIAGAGPVGLALSVALAHHGVRSVVLEESPALSEHSKAPGILPRTLETFAVWGILDRFTAQGSFLTRPQIWTPGRAEPLFTIDLSPLARTTVAPGILVLPQNRTEAILPVVARQTGRADVRFGQRVTGFTEDETGVTVSAQTTSGEHLDVRGEYLVGCDGPHSTVRETLGFPLEGKTYPTRLLLADVRVGDPRDALPWPRVLARNRGILAGLKIEPGLWRLIATLDAGVTDDAAASTAHIAGLVENVLGPGPFELVWASTFRIHCRTSPHFRRGRVLLAGDAAHINSPAGGQGMNSGIQDAHNLAWKLARALRGGHAESLLASYDAERRPAIVTNVDRYTDLLTRGVLLAPTPVRLGVLGLARLATSLPAVTPRLLRRAAMLDTRYDRSPLISGRGAVLGARAPDARLTWDGEEVRLHGLVAREAALLLFDDGRLPGWNVEDVEARLQGIDGLRVARIVPSPAHARLIDLVDVDGTVWHEWQPRPGTAALVRPDAHVGWMAERPAADELRAGVARALGVVVGG